MSKVIAQNLSVSMGLDVDHKGSCIFAFDIQFGELLFEGKISHSRSDWEEFLVRFPGCSIIACYEAGGIGFNLSRMLNELGVNCKVVAPSQVPRSANDKQQKNDRRDAKRLAMMRVDPIRHWVREPTVEEEADRQLFRVRYQHVCDRTRSKQQIKALLEFHQLKPPSGIKGLWTKSGMDWLKNVACESSVRIALNAHIATVEHLEVIIGSLDRDIKALSLSDKYKADCDRLTSQLSGVGTLLAMSLLTEVFRPWEFANAKALSCHIGFTPCEWSSGGRLRQGHITRWGVPHLRKLLVEAAWVWIRLDANARIRYREIRFGKEPKKAIVAMARRLAIVMWAMTVKKEDYNYQWAA